MTTLTTCLSATVVYVAGRGRCAVATKVTIKMGTVNVATAMLGGRYSQQQAVKEFQRFPKRFQPCDVQLADMVNFAKVA